MLSLVPAGIARCAAAAGFALCCLRCGSPDATPGPARDTTAVDATVDTAVQADARQEASADASTNSDVDATPDAAGTLGLWNHFGGFGADDARALTVDRSGNVLIAGSFSETLDLGCGKLQSAGGTDIFVVKYRPTASCEWSRRFGGTADDRATGIAAIADGDVIVTGSFQGVVDFGGEPLTSAGDQDIFLVRLDQAANHTWSERFGSDKPDWGSSVSVGPDAVVMTGWFWRTVDFGGGALTSLGDSWDGVVASFSPSGEHRWSKRLGGNGHDGISQGAVDGNGNVVVTGLYVGPADFGSGPLTFAGLSDIFLAKFTASGAPLWSKGFGNLGWSGGGAITTDNQNNVIVTGGFEGPIDFGTGAVTSECEPGVPTCRDGFIAEFSGDGVTRWSERFGGSTGDDTGASVTADESGNVYLSGIFYGSASLPGGFMLQSSGAADVFMAKLSGTGIPVWAAAFGGPEADAAGRVQILANGSLLAVGAFRGSSRFGDARVTSTGDSDVYVIERRP
jgi:hypothetical protein